jgi:hypothetical protein
MTYLSLKVRRKMWLQYREIFNQSSFLLEFISEGSRLDSRISSTGQVWVRGIMHVSAEINSWKVLCPAFRHQFLLFIVRIVIFVINLPHDNCIQWLQGFYVKFEVFMADEIRLSFSLLLYRQILEEPAASVVILYHADGCRRVVRNID